MHLVSFQGVRSPELSNPLDPSSPETGNTCFILSEVYESEAGVADHFQQATSSWDDFPAFVKWMENCKVTAVPAAGIFNSLW